MSMLASAYGQAVPKTASVARQNQRTETCGERREGKLRPRRSSWVRGDVGDAVPRAWASALEDISLPNQGPGRDTFRPAYAIDLTEDCQRLAGGPRVLRAAATGSDLRNRETMRAQEVTRDAFRSMQPILASNGGVSPTPGHEDLMVTETVREGSQQGRAANRRASAYLR